MIGIAQNHCSQNVITGNTLMGNMFEGITADNQADGAQVSMQLQQLCCIVSVCAQYLQGHKPSLHSQHVMIILFLACCKHEQIAPLFGFTLFACFSEAT